MAYYILYSETSRKQIRKLIDPSQGWYWTKEWQKMESDVDEEIENHQISPKFRTAEEGLKWLKK